MNYFPLLVQEMEVKIPAPVCEGVAHAATAWTLPPVVLHGKFDSQSSLVHPLVGNTNGCHHPHQENQVHCTLFPLRKESIKLGLHQKGNLISSKNRLRQSVSVIVHSIDEGENTQLD